MNKVHIRIGNEIREVTKSELKKLQKMSVSRSGGANYFDDGTVVKDQYDYLTYLKEKDGENVMMTDVILNGKVVNTFEGGPDTIAFKKDSIEVSIK